MNEFALRAKRTKQNQDDAPIKECSCLYSDSYLFPIFLWTKNSITRWFFEWNQSANAKRKFQREEKEIWYWKWKQRWFSVFRRQNINIRDRWPPARSHMRIAQNKHYSSCADLRFCGAKESETRHKSGRPGFIFCFALHTEANRTFLIPDPLNPVICYFVWLRQTCTWQE